MITVHDYASRNLPLLQQRWPALYAQMMAIAEPADLHYIDSGESPTLQVNGIHLSSCFDRLGEACLQAGQVAEGESSVWLYGVGCGDLQNELLRRYGLRQLDVVVLSLPLLKSVLRYFDHSAWLADSRVRLHVAAEVDEIRAPLAVVPTALRIVDDAAARLRDRLVLELESDHINARVRNNPQFRQQISDNAALVARDRDVEALFNSTPAARIYVAAAGPTLSEHYQRLKGRERSSMLIAVDAALKPLLGQGIMPDMVVTIDGIRDHIMALLDCDVSLFAAVPLIYFPIVHRDVLLRWPGPRYAAYANSPLYEALLQQHPKGMLYASGTVTHAATDLAVKMGAREVVLLGADFSFPGERSHVANAVFCEAVDRSAPTYQEWLVDGYGERVRTSKNLRGYLLDLERYIAQHPQVRFLNGSRNGALIHGTHWLEGA